MMKKVVLLLTTVLLVFVLSCKDNKPNGDTDGICSIIADDGTGGRIVDGVYRIFEPEHLTSLGSIADMPTKILFMNCVDMSNEPFNGIKKFAGTMDGNGKKIMNLNINEPDEENVGLIWLLEDSGSIANLTIESVENSGKVYGSNSGGIIGTIDNYDTTTITITIDYVYNYGTITSTGSKGGIIGYINIYNSNNMQVDINNSYDLNNTPLAIGKVKYSYGLNNTPLAIGEVYINTAVTVPDNSEQITEYAFRDKTTFIGWDFYTIWQMDSILGRPTLRPFN